MDLYAAIGKHAEWKIRFRGAIEKSETLDVDTISADNRCELGKWLSGDAKKLMGASPALEDCIAKHAAFHREAARVAEAINARKMAEATDMISRDTPYLHASFALDGAIIHLMEEIPG
jgi:methyl-accepting chemotaxis protein